MQLLLFYQRQFVWFLCNMFLGNNYLFTLFTLKYFVSYSICSFTRVCNKSLALSDVRNITDVWYLMNSSVCGFSRMYNVHSTSEDWLRYDTQNGRSLQTWSQLDKDVILIEKPRTLTKAVEASKMLLCQTKPGTICIEMLLLKYIN